MARDCDYSLKPHIEVKEYDTISMMIFSTRAIQMNLIFEILPVDSQYSLLALTNTVSAHHLDVVFMKSRCEFVLVSLLVSHNVGTHTAHISFFLDILFRIQSRVELPRKCFFWSWKVPLPYHLCNKSWFQNMLYVLLQSMHTFLYND